MTWLVKIADKADYLFGKYKKMIYALRDQYRAALYGVDSKDAYLERLKQDENHEFINSHWGVADDIDKGIKNIIHQCINWNNKYAEWLFYRWIKDSIPKNIARPRRSFLTFTAESTPLREMRDWLNEGHGRIPSLNTTLEEAQKMSDDWHKKMRSIERSYRTDNVIADLSDGFKLVNVPKEDAKAEGHAMGHCVGGYCERIATGRSMIMSIRDANNNPHATFELRPSIAQNENTSRDTLPEPRYWYIVQIKGKQNQAQPKYATQVGEALLALMNRYPITMDSEGLSDFYDFQPDTEERMRIMEAISAKSQDFAEADDLMNFHYYAGNGGIPDQLIYDWVRDNSHILVGEIPVKSNVLFKYLMDDTGMREDLLANLDTWHDDIVREDVDEMGLQMDPDDYMSEEDWEEFVEKVQRRKVTWYDVPYPLESYIDNWVDYNQQINDEPLVEYFLEEHRDAVMYKFMEDMANTIGYSDLPTEYGEWEGYYKRKQQKELKQHLTKLVYDCIEQNNIELPSIYGRTTFSSNASIVTVERIVDRLNPQDKKWLSYTSVFPDVVQNAIQQLIKEHEAVQQKDAADQKYFQQWLTTVKNEIPEIANLDEFHQLYIYNQHGRQPINVLRQVVEAFLQRKTPQSVTTNSLPADHGTQGTYL